LPDAVLLAMAMDPVEVPGMPRTGAMVYPGAAAPVVALPNTVPPAALLSAKVRAGVVVAVATEVVKSGLRAPALNVVTVPVPYGNAGMSAATRARNVGVAATPEAGPAHTRLADCVESEKEIAGVVVFVPTVTVAMESMFPEVTAVTVPYGSAGMSVATRARKVGVAFAPVAGPISAVFATWEIRDNVTAPTDSALLYTTESPDREVTPPGAGVGTYAETLPLMSTCHTTLVSPNGAGGKLPKLGFATNVPLTFTLPPEPYA
jgi:hypothetical protein